MAVTAGLVGPTGAELDNASNAALIDSMKFMRESKDNAIKRTFDQFWKTVDSSGLKSPKMLAASPGGQAMLRAGLKPWGIDSQKVADAMANMDVSKEEWMNIVGAASASGKLTETLERMSQPAVDKVPVGYTPEPKPGVVPPPADTAPGVPPTPPPPPPSVDWEPVYEPNIGWVLKKAGAIMLDPKTGKPFAFPDSTPARDAISALAPKIGTGEAGAGDYKAVVESYGAGPKSTLSARAIPTGTGKYYAVGPDGRTPLAGPDKRPLEFSTPEEASKASTGGKGAVSAATGSAEGGGSFGAARAKIPTKQAVFTSATGLDDSADGFRKWLVANQKAGAVYDGKVSESGTKDLRVGNEDLYAVYKNELGQGKAAPSVVLANYDKPGAPNMWDNPSESGQTTATRRETAVEKERVKAVTDNAIAGIRKTAKGITLGWKSGTVDGYTKSFLDEVLRAAQKVQDSDPEASLIAEVATQMRDTPRVALEQAKAELAKTRSVTDLNEANVRYVSAQMKILGESQSNKDPGMRAAVEELRKDPDVIQMGKAMDDARIAAKGDMKKYFDAVDAIKVDFFKRAPNTQRAWELNAALAEATTGIPGAYIEYIKKGGGAWFWKKEDQSVAAYTFGAPVIVPAAGGQTTGSQLSASGSDVLSKY